MWMNASQSAGGGEAVAVEEFNIVVDSGPAEAGRHQAGRSLDPAQIVELVSIRLGKVALGPYICQI